MNESPSNKYSTSSSNTLAHLFTTNCFLVSQATHNCSSKTQASIVESFTRVGKKSWNSIKHACQSKIEDFNAAAEFPPRHLSSRSHDVCVRVKRDVSNLQESIASSRIALCAAESNFHTYKTMWSIVLAVANIICYYSTEADIRNSFTCDKHFLDKFHPTSVTILSIRVLRVRNTHDFRIRLNPSHFHPVSVAPMDVYWRLVRMLCSLVCLSFAYTRALHSKGRQKRRATQCSNPCQESCAKVSSCTFDQKTMTWSDSIHKT